MTFLQRYLRSLLGLGAPVGLSSDGPSPVGLSSDGLSSDGLRPGSGLPWWRRYAASLVGVPLAAAPVGGGGVVAQPSRGAQPFHGYTRGNRHLLVPRPGSYQRLEPGGPAIAYGVPTATGSPRSRRLVGVGFALALIGGVIALLLTATPADTPNQPAPSTTAPTTPGRSSPPHPTP
ncbi:hypothetical protein [Streptomyces sp. NRRL WC-3742]|uniref:hypothetical protein n=1 Tax=Streptomyces sp. NRRL WC-3742 TaxID=1463934 RepID=UPI0004C74867|nr:hypothetical protein [Streptomyces sp. NRRL WC-3742]